MRLLLDESVPVRLKRHLPSHSVRTVVEMGWSGVRNGDLLKLAASNFDVFIRDFQPDFERIASLDAFAVIVSAPGDAVDYVYRFFAPRQGIPEDPVTGSANCTLVPYWSKRLGKSELAAKQLSARGGDLRCTLRENRVLMAGHAVEYLRGEITVEA